MTVSKLHRNLAKLIDDGHGRKRVCVDKSTFTHNLERDGAVILDAEAILIRTVEMLDDDGGWKINADGRVSTNTVAVIVGGTAA